MPRLLHISDLHFGAEDQAALQVVQDFAANGAFDSVIVSGDLTQHGRPAEFQAAADWLASLHLPIVATPGNHDVSLYNLYKRAFAPFSRYARFLESVAEVSLRSPELFIATINTARGWQLRSNWALGSVSRRQLQQAAALFADAPEAAHRLLVCHHPLIVPPESPLSGTTRRGKAAAFALTEMRVDLVLTGHLHMPFAQPLPVGDRATWSIGAGTLSRRQRGSPASFTILELGAATQTSQVVFIDDAGNAQPGPSTAISFRARRNSPELGSL